MIQTTDCFERGRWIAAVLGIALIAALPLPARSQSLSEALASAYATNPTLQAARVGLRAVNERVPQALSNWRPNVTVTGSAGKQTFEQQSSFFSAKQNTTPTEIELTVTQPLYRGGRTAAGTEAAENDVLGQRSIVTSVEQSVLLNAAIAYADVWRDLAVLELNVNNERVIQRQLEATQDRFTVGEVTRTDVAQAETRLATATADRIAAEGNLSTSKAVFQEVIGLAPGVLVAPGPVANLPVSADEVVALAIARNPDVLAASFAEKAAQNRVREVTGELLPLLQLSATARRTEESSQRDSSLEQGQVLVELTLPLYQQGAVSSRVREAKQISSQRRVEIEAQRRRVEQEAVSGWEALLTVRAQIRSFESGVRSAGIALEGVRQENLVGARTILDILDAEQELLDAKVNLVRSQRDEIVSSFQVLSVVGRLTARDLDLSVDLYEPEADYLKVRNRWFGLDAPGVE